MKNHQMREQIIMASPPSMFVSMCAIHEEEEEEGKIKDKKVEATPTETTETDTKTADKAMATAFADSDNTDRNKVFCFFESDGSVHKGVCVEPRMEFVTPIQRKTMGYQIGVI